jgi:hypothetical protein
MAKLLVKSSSLAALGGALLALGLLVYLADRPAGHAMLLPAWPRLAEGGWFGSVGQWLPSFVHPFAFSLLTVAALGPSPRPRYGVCVAWGVVNAAFELGQLPQAAAAIAAALHDGVLPASLSRALAAYFVQGRFDAADLAAGRARQRGCRDLAPPSPRSGPPPCALNRLAACIRCAPFSSRARCWPVSSRSSAAAAAASAFRRAAALATIRRRRRPRRRSTRPTTPPSSAAGELHRLDGERVGPADVPVATLERRRHHLRRHRRRDRRHLRHRQRQPRRRPGGVARRRCASPASRCSSRWRISSCRRCPVSCFRTPSSSPTDWSASPVPASNGATPVHVEESLASGGNPAAFRKMTYQIPSGAGSAAVFYSSATATWDAATQGAIRVIDYVEDCIQLQSSTTLYTESSLVIEQSGRRFLSDTPQICTATSWSTVSKRAALAPADFRLFDGPACATGEACPDFSASAAPMRFGYWRIGFGMPGQTIAHGIDNWKVTIWKR